MADESDNSRITPAKMMETAVAIGRQVVSLPEDQKDAELMKLKQADQMLHALVKNCLKDCRNGF